VADVPTLNQDTTGSAAKWTTARNLAGNSVDGSANVAFSNKFIVQGTTDAGLSAAQFLGALGTGILKNTTTTGVLSIAVAGDFPTLNQNTTGSAASLSVSGQTGLITLTGTTSTNRIKTVRDAADTILELGGSYTPTGTWTNLTLVTPTLGTPASGTVTNLTGTASININGTVGATTPNTVVGTTGTFGSTTSLLLGTAGSAVGNIGFRNATSGTATLAPPTGALGTYTVTLPNAASTLPIFGQQITFAGPTAARTITLPDAAFTVARTDAANTFIGASTATSWVFTTPVLGTPTSGNLVNCTGYVGTTALVTGGAMSVSSLASSGAISGTTGAFTGDITAGTDIKSTGNPVIYSSNGGAAGTVQAGLQLVGSAGEVRMYAATVLHATVSTTGFAVVGVITGTSSITTGAPNGAAAAWFLGSVTAGAVALDTANYVEVKIGGTVVKLLKAA